MVVGRGLREALCVGILRRHVKGGESRVQQEHVMCGQVLYNIPVPPSKTNGANSSLLPSLDGGGGDGHGDGDDGRSSRASAAGAVVGMDGVLRGWGMEVFQVWQAERQRGRETRGEWKIH